MLLTTFDKYLWNWKINIPLTWGRKSQTMEHVEFQIKLRLIISFNNQFHVSNFSNCSYWCPQIILLMPCGTYNNKLLYMILNMPTIYSLLKVYINITLKYVCLCSFVSTWLSTQRYILWSSPSHTAPLITATLKLIPEISMFSKFRVILPKHSRNRLFFL